MSDHEIIGRRITIDLIGNDINSMTTKEITDFAHIVRDDVQVVSDVEDLADDGTDRDRRLVKVTAQRDALRKTLKALKVDAPPPPMPTPKDVRPKEVGARLSNVERAAYEDGWDDFRKFGDVATLGGAARDRARGRVMGGFRWWERGYADAQSELGRMLSQYRKAKDGGS